MTRSDPSYGWILVAAAAVAVGVSMGMLLSLGVFLKPIEQSMGWTRTEISTVALVSWIFMGGGSLVWGALSDRFGSRPVVVAGGALLGLGLVASSQARSVSALYVTFGALVGFAVGAFYAPLTSTTTKWFTRNRGLAVGIVSAGGGLGTFFIAPLTRWLITAYGWRTAMVVLGDLAWLLTIPPAFLVRNPPRATASGARDEGPRFARDVSIRQIATSPMFWLIASTHFACCVGQSGPIFHMISNALDRGVAKMVAATVFGVAGLSSIAGRIGSGVLADRWGAKRTLIAGLALQAVCIALYLFPRDATAFYALAVPFGMAYGGVMPLYALLTRDAFGDRAMGTAYGGVFMIQAVGMGIGSFAGGWFYDRLGNYSWFFVASAVAGAIAIVLAAGLPHARSRSIAVAAVSS